MRTSLPNIDHWWHELTNCLHSTTAIVLRHRGFDPDEVLGAGWGFRYRPGDLRREEYYQPCPPGVSLVESLAPHHPVRSAWHEPAGSDGGAWAAVRAQVAAGRPTIVAADNYQLPFRPAFEDVHTNHLIVVVGFDDAAGEVEVIDSVPPRFHGWLPLPVLAAARGSANPVRHERDMFFTANPIGRRWLEVVSPQPIPAGPPLAGVLAANLAGFGRPRAGEWSFGTDGLAELFENFEARHGIDGDGADELFVNAGAALAGTALHADFLTAAAGRTGVTALAEAGRWVSRVAHHFTAVRILAARSRGRRDQIPVVRRRGRQLIADLGHALDAVQQAHSDLTHHLELGPDLDPGHDHDHAENGEIAWSVSR
jgi:Butirosin biosynthesis protein H, N-terminal